VVGGKESIRLRSGQVFCPPSLSDSDFSAAAEFLPAGRQVVPVKLARRPFLAKLVLDPIGGSRERWI